jgi:hypothetical protein
VALYFLRLKRMKTHQSTMVKRQEKFASLNLLIQTEEAKLRNHKIVRNNDMEKNQREKEIVRQYVAQKKQEGPNFASANND